MENGKTYTFKHTNPAKIKYTVIGGGILLMVIPILAVIFISDEEAFVIKMLLASLALTAITVYFFGRGITSTGKAELTENGITFHLSGKTKTIPFEAIQDYLIMNHNGVVIKLQLKDGEKFTVEASEMFCNPSALETLAGEVEKTVSTYNRQSSPDLSIQSAPNPYAKKWVLRTAQILTLLLLIAVVPVWIYGGSAQIYTLFFCASILATLWIQTKKAIEKEENNNKNNV